MIYADQIIPVNHWAPRNVWMLGKDGAVTRIALARTPNWSITDADDIKSKWWTWKNPDKLQQVKLVAEPGSNQVKITAWHGADPQNEFFYLELADNQFSGIDLNFLIANNPVSKKYRTDYDDDGRETLFGTVRRNLIEEQRAMQAGAGTRPDPRRLALFQYCIQSYRNFFDQDGASCIFP